MKLYYPAIFIQHEYGYTVEFPDLPGCITQGDTFEEAFEMAEDVACGWILTSIEDGEELPKPSPVGAVEAEEGFVNVMSLDIGEYGKKYGTKSVKKTLTIPEWLNSLAEKEGINFSQELQYALKDRLGLTVKNSNGDMTTILGDSCPLASLVSVISETFRQNSGETTMSVSKDIIGNVLPFNNAVNVS